MTVRGLRAFAVLGVFARNAETFARHYLRVSRRDAKVRTDAKAGLYRPGKDLMSEKLWKIFQQQDADGQPADLVQLESARTPRAGVSRRTFIEMIGFSAAALAFTSCRPPEQKIIPYLKQPVEFTPGVASWFASTCGGCSAGCGVLVKVRDGRPIKIEGNREHPLSGGGLCAVAHGMVFGLYDSDRLRQPLIGSKPTTWDEVDRQIMDILAATKKTGEKVRLLTGTITSPTSREAIAKFLSQFKDGKHVVYEAVSTAAIRRSCRSKWRGWRERRGASCG